VKKYMSLALVVALAGTAYPLAAQDNDVHKNQPDTRRDTQPENRRDTMKHDRRSQTDDMNKEGYVLVPSSRIQGVTVVGEDNARLGTVKDLILRPDSGRIVYLLVTKGITVDPRDPERYTPIPFAALTWDDQKKSLSLPMNERQFGTATSFSMEQWQSITEPSLTTAIYKYYNVPEDRVMLDSKYHRINRMNDNATDHDRRTDKDRDERMKDEKRGDQRRDAQNKDGRDGLNKDGHNMEHGENSLLRASDIRNQPLLTKDGRDMGRVNDVVFDGNSGRIAFVVITPASSLGVGDGRIGVPWPMFESDATGKLYAMDLDRDTLKSAPRFTQADWAELRNEGYTEDMYKRFGYDATGWNGTGMAMSSTERNSAWQTGYRDAMKNGTPRTITGKIESVSDEQAWKGSGRVTVINVKTDGGETVKVHTAPKDVLDNHKLNLKKGDTVTVTGKSVDMDGKQVLCAHELAAANGNRVTLYNDNDRGMDNK